MSIGNDPGAKKHQAKNIRKTSSPGKVYQSRASKPSAVDAIGSTTDLTGVDGTGNNAADLVTTEARLDALEAKLDELIAALKK